MTHIDHIQLAWIAAETHAAAVREKNERAQELYYKRTFRHLEKAIDLLSRPQSKTRKKK
jgi:hypothetical protein